MTQTFIVNVSQESLPRKISFPAKNFKETFGVMSSRVLRQQG
jgi:hypothetical protein